MGASTIMFLLLLGCCSCEGFFRIGSSEGIPDIYQIKLNIFLDANMKDLKKWVQMAIPPRDDYLKKLDKKLIFNSRTLDALQDQFEKFEKELLLAQLGITQIISNSSSFSGPVSLPDCCTGISYTSNKSSGEAVNRTVACQRVFIKAGGDTCNNINISRDVETRWKNNAMLSDDIKWQWFSSMHSDCVKTFIYPAVRHESICIEKEDLHLSRMEPIMNALRPKAKHWIFIFDLSTMDAVSLEHASMLAFTTVQFASHRDHFSVYGLQDSNESLSVHCNNTNDIRNLFSSHSTPDAASKLFPANATSSTVFPGLMEIMKLMLSDLRNDGRDTEKVAVLFTSAEHEATPEQHEVLVKSKDDVELLKSLHLVVFRLGGVFVPVPADGTYWDTRFNLPVKSKKVTVITQFTPSKSLNIFDFFPSSIWPYEPVTHLANSIVYSYPNEKKGVITLSMPVWNETSRTLDGVTGLDVSYQMVYDRINSKQEKNATVFMVDDSGNVIYHRLYAFSAKQGFVPVTVFEPALASYLRSIGASVEHFFRTIVDVGSTKIEEADITYDGLLHMYSCRRLARSQFVVCSVLVGDRWMYDVPPKPLEGVAPNLNADLVYHASVSSSLKESCRYFNQVSFSEKRKIGLFVSRRALRMFTIRNIEELKPQLFITYFNEDPIVFNSGRPELYKMFEPLSGVATKALRKLALFWSMDDSFESASFIRRYAASSDGYMIMQPATAIDFNTDIYSQQWFQNALGSSGTVFSSPWLDPAEAGYVVSVSWKVDLGNSTYIIVGFDVTVEGMYSHLLYNTVKSFAHTECNPELGFECFLFNHEGNLVAHPRIWNSSLEQKVEHPGQTWRDINIFSVAYRETTFFSKVREVPEFFKTEMCYDFEDNNRRFTQFFNPDFVEIPAGGRSFGLKNCSMYDVRRLPGTNLLLCRKNLECIAQDKVQSKMCLCMNTAHGRCFPNNIHELPPCWCPCTRPFRLESQSCSKEAQFEEHWKICERLPDTLKLLEDHHQSLRYHSECYEYRCNELDQRSACDQNRGCRWCEFEQVTYFNGTNSIYPLEQPECQPVVSCYMGIKDFTPYYNHSYLPGQLYARRHSSTTTPIGPVAGGILASTIVICLAVFLVRHERQRRNLMEIYNANYLSDVNLQNMTPREEDPDDPSIEQDDDVGNLNPIIQLAPQIRYQPHRHVRQYGSDSDHGYSTMSPHEDSEPNPGAYSDATSVDRSVIGHNSSPTDDDESDRASSCTGVSSSTVGAAAKKRAQQLQQETRLNEVEATVEVHQVPPAIAIC